MSSRGAPTRTGQRGGLARGAPPGRSSARAARPSYNRLYSAARWHWALCYVLYALVLYVCYRSFWLWRATLERALAVRFLHDRDWFPAVYLAATAVMGLVIFCIVVGSESHLRTALASTYYPPRRFFLRLLWRAVHVGLVLALLVGGAVGLQEWIIRSIL